MYRIGVDSFAFISVLGGPHKKLANQSTFNQKVNFSEVALPLLKTRIGLMVCSRLSINQATELVLVEFPV